MGPLTQTDARFGRAIRAIRKLLALGLSEDDIFDVSIKRAAG